MKIIDRFSRFDNIRSVAYNCKKELDKKSCSFDKSLASKAYMAFLNAKYYNATTADSAMREVLKKHPIKYPKSYKNNLENLRDNSFICFAEKYNDKYITKRYNNTLKARTMLITNDRILLLNQVLPKAKGIQKALLKLKLFFKF